MKLRNKKTGEIGYLYANKNENYNVLDENGKVLAVYTSLKGVVEEWEDAPEEPKWLRDYWFIDSCGSILKQEDDVLGSIRREIGNYFKTEEEAEKAVEKLKCFTNLKNHEFMFDGWYYGTDGNIVILANAYKFNDMEEQDLTKVFGEKIC